MTDTNTNARVTVVGSYNHGLTVSTPYIPVPGETVLGSDFVEGVGGKGSNQAVAAARLGAAASFVGCVGSDRFADDALSLWAADGVDAAVTHVEDAHTGVGIVIVNEDGENAIVVAPGANSHLDRDAVENSAAAITTADVLLCQLETTDEPVAAAGEIAAANETEFILNPAPAREVPADVLTNVDVLTPNKAEALMLAGHPPDADLDAVVLAEDLLEMGPDAVVVTLGGDGALVATAEMTRRVPSADVDVVDTTGAGDAFNAGFAVARGEGASLVDAARFGCRAGGLACTAYEVVPALPDREAVETL
ncbi:ribokinase [Haladaptatus sp. NG-WS-4]